jgi:hypothetical protein
MWDTEGGPVFLNKFTGKEQAFILLQVISYYQHVPMKEFGSCIWYDAN